MGPVMSFAMDANSCQAVDDALGTGQTEEIMFFGRAFAIIEVDFVCQNQLNLPLSFANETLH